MSNLLEILDWDTNFFGYKVAKITALEISVEQLQEITEYAKEKDIKLIYLFSDPSDIISNNSANTIGGNLVDKKITFHIKIDDSVKAEIDEHIVEYDKMYPSDQLIGLSLQSGLYSRYKLDPHFVNNEFERMYLIWVENSVNKKIADHTIVYIENEVELGFVTLKIKNNCGQIGLIAVDEKSRGKSIGKKLIASVIQHLKQMKIPDLEVATQLDNENACRFYEKNGFRESKTENIYHIWIQ